MKWVLIIMTFWRPDVQIKVVEQEFNTEQECLDRQYELEQVYLGYQQEEKYTGFGYILMCEQRD
jgi:hypothetical protein